MTEEEVRSSWIAFCRSASEEAIAAKESQAALFAMSARYRGLAVDERRVVDALLGEQLELGDEAVRFDALALIEDLRITSALPALRELAARLESDDSPGAPYEWAKVNRILGALGGGR